MSTRFHRLAGISLLILFASGCYDFTHETIAGSHPVKEMKLTRLDGKPYELMVHVQSGVRLDSLVDISYFDGLEHGMSLETAKRRLGELHRVRTQADMKIDVHLYPVPKGEVGFMAVPGSEGFQHQVWAYPTNKSPASVILDASFRKQLLSRLPSNQPVRVHVPRNDRSGAITLNMTSNRVDYLILGPRDGDPL